MNKLKIYISFQFKHGAQQATAYDRALINIKKKIDGDFTQNNKNKYKFNSRYNLKEAV